MRVSRRSFLHMVGACLEHIEPVLRRAIAEHEHARLGNDFGRLRSEHFILCAKLACVPILRLQQAGRSQ